MILSLLCIISSCAVQEKIVYKDVPAGYVIVSGETLDKLLTEMIRTKSELMECLERERAK